MSLAVNYTNGELDTAANNKRIYRFTALDDTVVFEGTVEDISAYRIQPSISGAQDINETNRTVNDMMPEAGEDIRIER